MEKRQVIIWIVCLTKQRWEYRGYWSTYNDGNGTDAGHVRIYKNINGTWTQQGSDIDGEAAADVIWMVCLTKQRWEYRGYWST